MYSDAAIPHRKLGVSFTWQVILLLLACHSLVTLVSPIFSFRQMVPIYPKLCTDPFFLTPHWNLSLSKGASYILTKCLKYIRKVLPPVRLFPGSPPILWHLVFQFSFILSIHQTSCLGLQQYRCHFLACSQKQELGEHGYLLMGDSTLQRRDVSLSHGI